MLEACRARRPTQKMVVLSNHATNDVRWRCAQLGADAVFDKSTEIDALVDYCVRERVKVEPEIRSCSAQVSCRSAASASDCCRSRLGASAPAESRIG